MTDIWLDTSIVLNWNPRLDTVEAHTFLKYARDFNHRVFLNEIVLRELTKQYADRATKCINRHKNLEKDIARLALPVSLVVEGTLPTDPEEYYRNLLIKRCGEESITITPLHPELEGELIQRLIQMGVKHTPPFQNRGSRAFKDVLIVLSVLEYARHQGEDRVIVLAADNDFTEETITDLSIQYGVKLDVFQSVSGFTAYLDELATKKSRREKQKQMKRVHSFLLSQKDKISLFIRNNFDMEWLPHPTRLALALGASYGIKSVLLEEITIVTLTSEHSKDKGVTTLFITFEAIVNVQLGSPKIWVAGEAEPYIIPGVESATVHGFGLPESLDRQEKIRVHCEATAVEDAAGELSSFQMKGARSNITISPGTGTLTIGVQERGGVGFSDRAYTEKIEWQPPLNAD